MTKSSKSDKPQGAWATDLSVPCDPELFLKGVQAWQDGQDIPLRDANAKREPGRLYLNDAMPENRAAMHTITVLKGAGVENPQAYLWRIMHLHEILEGAAAMGLGDMVREDGVHLALLHAAAVAKLNLPPGGRPGPDMQSAYDMADVAAKAREFRDQMPDEKP